MDTWSKSWWFIFDPYPPDYCKVDGAMLPIYVAFAVLRMGADGAPLRVRFICPFTCRLDGTTSPFRFHHPLNLEAKGE